MILSHLILRMKTEKEEEKFVITLLKSHVCIFRAFANFGSIIIKEVLILKYEKKKKIPKERVETI